MEIVVLHEAGHALALRGLAYSYFDGIGSPAAWFDAERQARADARSLKLAGRGGGHDKFLRQIMVWLDCAAPRYWWSEMDTYKFVVGQSTSTMHTLDKCELTAEQCASGTSALSIDAYNATRRALRQQRDAGAITGQQYIAGIKAALPEGFIQRRLIMTSYATLGDILRQRAGHRLPEWRVFCQAIRDQVQSPGLLPPTGDNSPEPPR